MSEREKQKLKIGIVAPSMRVLGGQSVQAKRLLDMFSDDEEISLQFIPNDPILKTFPLLQEIKFVRTIVTSFKFWWLLVTKLSKVDIVHVFSSGTTSYVISTLPPLFIAKFIGKKTILHYHTGEAEDHLKKWGWLAISSMKEFDEIVVPSQFLVDVFKKFGLKAKAIFNCVESRDFIFRERVPLKPIFLSNRAFEKHYNVGCVLRAFQLIQKECKEASLIVAGTGSREQELKNLTKELDLKNVEFIGRVSQEEMPQVYERADIYLNASIVDNMPLSIIEAFSCGLPVISTNVGGIPYIIEDGKTGHLVENGDFRDLAKCALQIMVKPQTTHKLISEALKESEKYKPREVYLDWAETYKNSSNK